MKARKYFIKIHYYWYSLLTNLFGSTHFSKYKLKYGTMLLTLAVGSSCNNKINNEPENNPLPTPQDSTVVTDSIQEQLQISCYTPPVPPSQETRKKAKKKVIHYNEDEVIELKEIEVVAIAAERVETEIIACYVATFPTEAQYPGGSDELMHFFNNNLKYPNAERIRGTEGIVVAEFAVDKTGKISDIKIVKSLSKSCDKEVIRVLNLMPKWIPAKQSGMSIATTFTLPVRFNLDNFE